MSSAALWSQLPVVRNTCKMLAFFPLECVRFHEANVLKKRIPSYSFIQLSVLAKICAVVFQLIGLMPSSVVLGWFCFQLLIFTGFYVSYKLDFYFCFA